MYRCLILTLLAFCTTCLAADLAAIKQDMRERLDTLNDLKERQIIGETNDGYLAYVGEARPHQDVVQAENADRRKVYKAIARQTGAKLSTVEKARAKEITQQSKPGIMLQDGKGDWYEKPD